MIILPPPLINNELHDMVMGFDLDADDHNSLLAKVFVNYFFMPMY